MNTLAPWQWALMAALLLLIGEVLTGAFVALSLAVGCVAVAITEVVGPEGAGWLRDVAVFALAAGVALVVLRRFFARPGDSRTAGNDVNDY